MTEIKFRAWHRPSKRIFKVWSITPDDYIFEDSNDGVGTSPTLPANASDCDISQYSGIKDKGGVEIFEGDLIKIKNGDSFVIAECVRKPGYFTLVAEDCGEWTRQLFHEHERLEVIGNIYENKKLKK